MSTSEVGFTEGPWETLRDADGGTHIVAKNGRGIALMYGHKAQENAAAIIQMPKMHDLLVARLATLDWQGMLNEGEAAERAEIFAVLQRVGGGA